MLEDIENDVSEWHKKTFPNATMEAITLKFIEELEEFESELALSNTDIYSAKSIEEFSDMCIVYIAGLSKVGEYKLSSHIRQKLNINKNRSWGEETENGDRPRVKS